VCCVTQGGGDGGAGFGYVCESAANCMGGNSVGLQCAGTADCPTGQVCCLNNAGNAASCATMCAGGPGNQLCDPGAPNNGGCPQGTTCTAGGADGLPMNYGTCG
jgi:hypothetical protein